MLLFNFKHITPSAEIEIHLKATLTKADLLNSYQDKNKFEKLCAEGCPNYGSKWACPPFSPSYSNLSNQYSNALLVLLYCNLSQFNYTKTEYMKIKASNSILKSKSDRLLRYLEEKSLGIMLSNGSCRLCSPCNRKKGLGCKKPMEMRYSMESLGLDVEKISLELLHHQLLWYQNKLAPEYASVVGGVLMNEQISISDLQQSIQTYIEK